MCPERFSSTSDDQEPTRPLEVDPAASWERLAARSRRRAKRNLKSELAEQSEVVRLLHEGLVVVSPLTIALHSIDRSSHTALCLLMSVGLQRLRATEVLILHAMIDDCRVLFRTLVEVEGILLAFLGDHKLGERWLHGRQLKTRDWLSSGLRTG